MVSPQGRLGRAMSALVAVAAVVAMLCAATAMPASATSVTKVWAWGWNSFGQLGDGTFNASYVPVEDTGLSGTTAVSAGGNHSLFLLSNGGVMEAGCAAACYNVPTAVSGLTTVTAVAAGGDFSLALLSNGKVMAWGANGEGELGNGTITASVVPVAVSGLRGVKAVSAGSQFGLALLDNGTVMAWGFGANGELGNGTAPVNSPLPVAVSGLRGVKAVSAGNQSSVALLSNDTVKAWGDNVEGELGTGTSGGFSDVPVAVTGLRGVKAVSAGVNHCMALLRNGTVRTWGLNTFGELGNGTTGGFSAVPVAVSRLSSVIAISDGGQFSLALLSSSNIVMGWGGNAEGELGTGTTRNSDVPVPVGGLSGVTAVSAGDLFSLALA
jgi:alpha-tubulin suppressor-like RCC1 family protein